MKTFNKISATILSIILLFSTFSAAGPNNVLAAASDPGLGAAATFSILAQTAITGTGTISGDVGLNSTGAGITALTDPMVGGTIYSTDGVAPSTAILAAAVQANASTAFTTNIPGQPLTSNQGPVLDGLTLTTGVYDIGAGRLNGGVLTLDGPGIYIFRASSDFVSSGSINLINGARACDVYWRVATLATINGSSFAGTILAGTGVHFGANVTLDGRALAVGGGDVTLITDTISGPTCAASAPATIPASGGVRPDGTISVVKMVINDNGGTKTVADFQLFVNDARVFSGLQYSFSSGAYAVTETANPKYTKTFSGDCDASGQVSLALGDNKFCIITNNDIGAPLVVPPVPPLIDMVKIASPLSLPAGQGSVVYTYTLRNTGTVPVTNITITGDTCSPIVLASGDTNGDQKLNLSETWTYRCSTMLTETHTNTAVATGWANGISAVDVASATVVVGSPLTPPLIHVVKTPNVFVAPSNGAVTYTYKVTNPGTAPLSNVSITDDRCTGLPGRVSGHPGDLNGNNLLESNEIWSFTCQTNLTQTTTNIGTAKGSANGLTATDLAVATVVVTPKFPNTGIAPDIKSIPWNIVIPALVGIFAVSIFYFTRKKASKIV